MISMVARNDKSRPYAAERGVALLEFAIVLPFVLLLLLGAIEVGRFAYFGIITANAARAGAQYGAQNLQTALDSTGIASAAHSDAVNAFSALTVTSATSCACWNGTSYTALTSATPLTCASGNAVEFVTVTASGTANALLNYRFLPSVLSTSATAKLRVVAQ
jgi:Flp pilus assembly protein TadG